MKFLKPYILFLCAAFMSILCASCEKVIDVRIQNVDKKYVIEGSITDNQNTCRVLVSQTIDLADTNRFEGVSNAVITLQENNKPPVRLLETDKGIYRADMKGAPGHTYTLKVTVGNQTFTASSVMPQKTQFDTLYITERVSFGKPRKIPTLEFQDPNGMGNAYRFIQYVNGRKENTIFITDDHLTNGRKVTYELLIFSNEAYLLQPGDHLRVEMYCIDHRNFDFWYSLSQGALGQSQSASPANPVTNISGGALGYFSAATFDSKNLEIE